jgi:hypothetical protein
MWLENEDPIYVGQKAGEEQITALHGFAGLLFNKVYDDFGN